MYHIELERGIKLMALKVSIAGVSMTRFGKFLNKSVKDLVQESVSDVLIDAGLEKDDIQAVFFGNCVQGHMEGQDMIRGQVALRPLGFEKLPIFNIENACATASTAFHLGFNYICSGAADIVLAVGAENEKILMFANRPHENLDFQGSGGLPGSIFRAKSRYKNNMDAKSAQRPAPGPSKSLPERSWRASRAPKKL